MAEARQCGTKMLALLLVALQVGSQAQEPPAPLLHGRGFVRRPRDGVPEIAEITDADRRAAPATIDWSTKGATTPVKDQGQCGSCWAFSTVEGIESAVFMATGKLPVLSTQQIISCDKADDGCDGGDLPTALHYVEKAGGIDTSSDYPDRSHNTGETGSCKWDGKEVAQVSSFKYAVKPCDSGSCKHQDEDTLAAAVAKFGPLSVCVNAQDWDPYQGGVYKKQCSSRPSDMDHCVQLVGYDKTAPTPYWKVRNSWNTDWGEDGFMKLPMGENACGIANEAVVISAAEAANLHPVTPVPDDGFVEIVETHQNRAHWKKMWFRHPAPFSEHEVVFSIRPANLERLRDELLNVSMPGSPRYGKHLSFDAVGQILQTEAAAKRVMQWVHKNVENVEVARISPRGEYVRIKAPIASLEKALQTKFHYWRSDVVGKVSVRCERYYLPRSLAADVHAIFRTVDFPPLVKPSPRVKETRGMADAPGATNYITPEVLNSFYRIGSNAGSTSASQAVFETSGQTFSPSDLSSFQSQFGIPSEGVSKDIGGHKSDYMCELNPNNCAEANLDVQYLMAVSQETPTTYFYEANEEDPFLAFVEAVSTESKPSLVNSISYGSVESEISRSTMEAFNTEVMKLGTMGISVFVSSGDDGVANYMVSSQSQCAYNPSYPATSPYVTAVGATYAPSWQTPGQGEIVCQSNVDNAIITSGGGFSAIFDRPSWQSAAVQGYFEKVSQQPKSGYATNGRGYPDVSLSGFGYQVVIGGSVNVLCGTSCSAPSVAGMVSLVNSVRIEAGGSPLGFLNPAIYQAGGIFNDVTSGENQCTARGQVCCSQGFYAAEGWDPTTGFGSVDFTKFKQAFTADLDPAKVQAAEERLAAAAKKVPAKEIVV